MTCTTVKVGCILQEREFCTHIGYYHHRLESSPGIVFNGRGVKKSPRADDLVLDVKLNGGSLCPVVQQDELGVIQDVDTRWRPTFPLIPHLLYLDVAIELLE